MGEFYVCVCVCARTAVKGGLHANIWRGLYCSARGLKTFRQKKGGGGCMGWCSVHEGPPAVHWHVWVYLKWSVHVRTCRLSLMHTHTNTPYSTFLMMQTVCFYLILFLYLKVSRTHEANTINRIFLTFPKCLNTYFLCIQSLIQPILPIHTQIQIRILTFTVSGLEFQTEAMTHFLFWSLHDIYWLQDKYRKPHTLFFGHKEDDKDERKQTKCCVQCQLTHPQ